MSDGWNRFIHICTQNFDRGINHIIFAYITTKFNFSHLNIEALKHVDQEVRLSLLYKTIR